MTERGTVVKTDGKRATVKVDKKDECSKCGMCLFPKNASYTEFYANDKLGVKVGDDVLVEKTEKGKLLAIALVFLVPLILIGIGTVIGLFALKNEIYVLVLSLGFCIVWFVILAIIDKNIKNRSDYNVEIIKIYEKENSND